MKQVATAFHSFESANRYFPGFRGEAAPMDTIFDAARIADAKKMPMTGNWLIQSCNYMELGQITPTLLRAARREATAAEVLMAVKAAVPVLYCPSRREPIAYPLFGSEAAAWGVDKGGRTDYAINGGSGVEVGNFQALGRVNAKIEYDGIWALGRQITAGNVADGLSHTYLVGEKSMDALQYTTGKDHGDRAPISGLQSNSGASNSYVRFAVRSPKRDTRQACTACHDFGSAHISGWNMSLADGSVRAFSYGMDIGLHRALASINGGDARYDQ